MVENQTECSKHEHRSVIKFLPDEDCKSYEIYKRICDLYRDVCFNQNNVYYEPESKSQSVRWKHRNSPVKKMFWAQQ